MTTRAQGGAITVGDKGRVTLSETLREQLGIREGDVLLSEVTDHGTIELIPVALVPRDQVWFAHPDVQQRVTEARDDIVANRTTRVTSQAEMKKTLAGLRKQNRHD